MSSGVNYKYRPPQDLKKMDPNPPNLALYGLKLAPLGLFLPAPAAAGPAGP